jgi:hypothetical protein
MGQFAAILAQFFAAIDSITQISCLRFFSDSAQLYCLSQIWS